MARTRKDLIAHIRAERDDWHALLDEIGTARMEQPGPMGEWTFKDLVGHLLGWRARTIALIDAGPGGKPAPAWPASLTGDDEINDWIHAQYRDRPLDAVLAEADRSYERLESAITSLPEDDLTTPGRFAWMEGKALVDGDFFGHLHEEHEASIREWLRTRGPAPSQLRR